jgi:hypothetical protein
MDLVMPWLEEHAPMFYQSDFGLVMLRFLKLTCLIRPFLRISSINFGLFLLHIMNFFAKYRYFLFFPFSSGGQA